MTNPPLIVIGMHRSGTTLLTRALQQAGLFMGLGASRNEEAAFTNAVNAWYFRQAAATWDRPESVDSLLADPDLQPWLHDYVGGVIDGPAAVRFLGPARWLRARGLSGMDQPWGFKDPRNTYTLPLWLAHFPQARVVHIVRHGVDVAASLRARRAAAVDRRIQRYRQRRWLYHLDPLAPKRGGFGSQPRCATLAGGFDLWEQYVTRARSHVAERGDTALEVAYESLLTTPQAEIERVLDFCGLSLDGASLRALTDDVDPARARAYRRDAEASEFAANVAPRLAALGYEPLAEGGP